jgi:hypothetical protein
MIIIKLITKTNYILINSNIHTITINEYSINKLTIQIITTITNTINNLFSPCIRARQALKDRYQTGTARQRYRYGKPVPSLPPQNHQLIPQLNPLTNSLLFKNQPTNPFTNSSTNSFTNQITN